MTLYIPDCAWHTCAAQETLPNPDQLPAEGCQLVCKGPFEAMFANDDTDLNMGVRAAPARDLLYRANELEIDSAQQLGRL